MKMPMMVVSTMEISSAPLDFHTAAVIVKFHIAQEQSQNQADDAELPLGWLKSAKPLTSGVTRPQEFRPMRAISRPTAPPMPILMFLGRSLANSSRSLNTEISKKDDAGDGHGAESHAVVESFRRSWRPPGWG